MLWIMGLEKDLLFVKGATSRKVYCFFFKKKEGLIVYFILWGVIIFNIKKRVLQIAYSFDEHFEDSWGLLDTLSLTSIANQKMP